LRVDTWNFLILFYLKIKKKEMVDDFSSPQIIFI
jgi:hypothetical protein